MIIACTHKDKDQIEGSLLDKAHVRVGIGLTAEAGGSGHAGIGITYMRWNLPC